MKRTKKIRKMAKKEAYRTLILFLLSVGGTVSLVGGLKGWFKSDYSVTVKNEDGIDTYIIKFKNKEYRVVELDNDFVNLRDKDILINENELTDNSILAKVYGNGSLFLATGNFYTVDNKEFEEVIYYDETSDKVLTGLVCTDYLKSATVNKIEDETFEEKVIKLYNDNEGKQLDYDGNSGPQCVDFIKFYLKEIFNFDTGSVGNAVDYGNYENFKNHNLDEVLDYIAISDVNEIKFGDILVFGANYSSNHNFGHVAVATGKKIDGKFEVMEIGGEDPKTVRKNKNSLMNVIAVLRPKQELIDSLNNNSDLDLNELQILANRIFNADDELSDDSNSIDITGINEIKSYLQEYAKIYHLNYSVAFDKLSDLTENFTSESFVTELKFDGLSCKNMDVKPESYEEFVIYYMRILEQDPERFDLRSEEIVDNKDYSSDIDYPVYIYNMCQIFDEDPSLIWAVCMSESHFKSEVFTTYNNPSGIVGDSKWMSFPTEEAGIIETILQFKKYRSIGADSIEEFGAIHCPVGASNDPSHLNENWIGNVTYYYNYANDNFNELFKVDSDVNTLKLR